MGASHLRFVLATADGQILAQARDQVSSEHGPSAVIAQIRTGIASVLEQKPESGTVRGIAIGVPGGVDPRTGKVLEANNVPGWHEVDMGGELEEAFQLPVYLDNDANMAAIGERWRGVARGVDDFVFIALGTGIGAGLFVNGQISRGRNGFAGELFRMNLEWPRWNEDFPDTGYLEAYVSGRGLATEGRKVLAEGNGRPLNSLAESRDARFVFDALRKNHPQAKALVEKSFVMLGVGVANIANILDPELIVFNGGLVQGAPEMLLEIVERVVARIHPRPPHIRFSTLGDQAQIWGALHTVVDPARHNGIPASKPQDVPPGQSAT